MKFKKVWHEFYFRSKTTSSLLMTNALKHKINPLTKYLKGTSTRKNGLVKWEDFLFKNEILL